METTNKPAISQQEQDRQENIKAIQQMGRCDLVCLNPDCPDDPTHPNCFFINKAFGRNTLNQN